MTKNDVKLITEKKESEEYFNKNYRDRVFKFIFGNPENKDLTLVLYNAVNNSAYTDPSKIQFNTIDDAVYMGMKNDTSFIIDSFLNLYEQQSTYNPNMPLRFLLYLAKIYNKYIHDNNLDIFSSAKLQIPTPKCVCFYNGRNKKVPEKEVLTLSSAFVGGRGDVELYATVYNINSGKNEELKKKCKPLADYSLFVDTLVKSLDRKFQMSEAVDNAIEVLPEGRLRTFLENHKMEVNDMCLFEYDEKFHIDNEKKLSKNEGRTEKEIEMISGMRAFGLTEDAIQKILNLSSSEKTIPQS